MPDPVLEYTTVATVMRPPRLVILFRGDANWRAWARLALSAAGATWAGGGHLLVPYDVHGRVSPVLVDAVRAFDPDHVVLLTYTLSEYEAVAPGELTINVDGHAVEGDERARVIAADPQFREHDPAGHAARASLVAACTPFVTQLLDGEPHDLHRTIGGDGDWGAGLPASSLVGADAVYTAVPRHWSSDKALLAAALIGLEPRREYADGDPEPEGPEVLNYALKQPRPEPPSSLIAQEADSGTEHARPWLETIDVGVQRIVRGYNPIAGVVVVGDSADDFALAVAADRMLGPVLWVTSDMVHDSKVMPYAALPLLGRRNSFQADAVFTSASPNDEVAATFAELRAQLQGWSIGDSDWIPESVAPIDWSSNGRLFRAVGEAIGQLSTIPVLKDASGTLTMATQFALPAPRDPALTGAHPKWYIDVSFSDSTMPTGRGLGPTALRGGRDPESVNVRSGRDGLCVIAQSYGFVAAGAVLSSAMARPVLRDLGMLDWTNAQASGLGLSAQYSTPGQHAQLVAARLGSRDALTDLLAGPAASAIKCYMRVSKASDPRSKEDSPDRIVVLDNSTPYLTIDRMTRASVGLSAQALRSTVDDLCRQHLARRGLILRCTDCGRGSFVGLHDLAQRFTCPRCEALNDLDAWSWRSPTPEPHWYYDLHPSLREIISTSGDIPLLAAAHFKKSARRYADCAEIEFSQRGRPIAEIDLIAHADGKVILVEAKAGASLGSTQRQRAAQAAKLARIARVLRADEVVLATTRPAWDSADTAVLETALAEATPAFASRPVVRTLVGLGAGGVTD